MALNLNEVYEFLRESRYLLSSKAGYTLSKTFTEDIKRLQKPVTDLIISNKIDWKTAFVHFIITCKVPVRIQTNTGWYDCNKYSEEAMKRFKDMIGKEGVNLELLILSTTLYYKSGNSFKKKISNYILDGDWMTDYMTLQAKAEEGGTAIKDHIKEEIKTNEAFDPYS